MNVTGSEGRSRTDRGDSTLPNGQADVSRAPHDYLHDMASDQTRKDGLADKARLVEQCDQVRAAGSGLRRPLPMLQRERTLHLARDTTNATVGFRSAATDRPVVDWLLSSTRDARHWRADEESRAAVDRP
jgi:hypothetical protein